MLQGVSSTSTPATLLLFTVICQLGIYSLHHHWWTRSVTLEMLVLLTFNLASWPGPSPVPGTLAYMPPESFDEHSRYGPQLDIFSFGHLALFTLTQVRRIEGRRQTTCIFMDNIDINAGKGVFCDADLYKTIQLPTILLIFRQPSSLHCRTPTCSVMCCHGY